MLYSCLICVVYWWWDNGITNSICKTLLVLLDKWHATTSAWRCNASSSSISWVGHCLLSPSCCTLQPWNGQWCTGNSKRWLILGSPKTKKLKVYSSFKKRKRKKRIPYPLKYSLYPSFFSIFFYLVIWGSAKHHRVILICLAYAFIYNIDPDSGGTSPVNSQLLQSVVA